MSLLTACSDDDIDRVYTVGEADNAIVLKVGVREGSGTQIATRGEVDGNHDATNKTDGSNVYGGGHTPFKTTGTKLALRIDGAWTGKGVDGKISQTTNVTLKAATSASYNKHNPIDAMSPTLYWDDYGTADPNNTTGRAAGLTIYGIGVDGYETAVPSFWTAVEWNVGAPDANGSIDQSGTTYWLEKDLLTSNNIHEMADGKDYDGTYKFDDYLHDKPLTTESDKTSSNILEFTHTMTKITVQLTAGEGFPRTEAENPNTAHFVAAPTVTLEGFYYKGSVNVEEKSSTHSNDDATANIKMHLNGGGAAHTATFDALVFPGNEFADNTQILTFTADGNTLHVTATELNKAIKKAIDAASTTGYPTGSSNLSAEPKVYDLHLLQAWNYLLKITVKKTDLDITATILDWKTVEAEEDTPKINVTEVYGHEGSAFAQNFDFFRSMVKAGGYRKDAYVAYDGGKYTFHDQLYWPDHQTHYFFRGVYPRVQTNSEAGWIPTDKVSSSTSSASTIAVSNVPYEAGKYPSDLALGWPKTEGDAVFDETCKVHTDKEGICATEGQIRMNFKYVMSKVQFSLKSSGTEGENKVDLSNVVVEIIDGYQSGKIRLSDGKHENFVADDKRDYVLNKLASPETDYNVTTLDAIVPQTLGNDVKIRITVRDVSKNVLDVYEAQLNKIKDSSSAEITEWLPGNYYKYYLDINKTAINVTATLTDWVTVEASDEVWF